VSIRLGAEKKKVADGKKGESGCNHLNPVAPQGGGIKSFVNHGGGGNTSMKRKGQKKKKDTIEKKSSKEGKRKVGVLWEGRFPSLPDKEKRLGKPGTLQKENDSWQDRQANRGRGG